MIKIGEFSKLSRISIRMLRYYDEMGLLRPIYIDDVSGYRYYQVEQLADACRISMLKDMGFGLSAISQLLPHFQERDVMENALCQKKAELISDMQALQTRLRLLDTALERLRKDETMHCDVTLKTIPKRYAATVRMHIPVYEMEGTLWSTLCSETAHMQLVPDDPCLCCAVFHDKEYREENVDVEIQKTVVGNYPDTEHVQFRTLPPVTVASAICKGSYSQLSEAMAAVAQWITDNGYTMDGPTFNIYHISPHETSDPDAFVTEICYPVRKE